jgi:hypothetical protein
MKRSSLRGQNSVDLWIPGAPDAGIGYPGKPAEAVGFEWRSSVSLLRGGKVHEGAALAVERGRAGVKSVGSKRKRMAKRRKMRAEF